MKSLGSAVVSRENRGHDDKEKTMSGSLQERIKRLEQEREQYVGKKWKVQIEGEKLSGVEFYDRLIARPKEKISKGEQQ
jgi:hypothetical protein